MIAGFVRGQTLRLSVPRIAADTIDYLTAKFLFQSSDWDGLGKWAHFAQGEAAYDICLTDDEITADAHLNLSAGKWKVYLHGNRYADGAVVQRITTEVQELEVLPTGMLNGEPFPEMPASVTEQILARLDNVEQNGGGSGGLNPVDKTDAMTAEVGRDDEGRLWAKESRKGVKNFGFGRVYYPDPTRPQGRYLGVGLEDETTALVLIQDLARELGIDKILGLPEYTEADEGKVLGIVNGKPAWVTVQDNGTVLSGDESGGVGG